MGSFSRPPLNLAPPCTYLTQIERQHTERCFDGILMGNGFLITSQINMSAVYSVALFVFSSFAVRSCSSTSTPSARVFLLPFLRAPDGKKKNECAKIALPCVSPSLPWHQMLRSISIAKPKTPQIKYFPNPDPKTTLLVEAEPVFEQGQCEDSSQDSKRSLFSFGPGEVYFPPLIIPALFSQQPSYLHSHSWRLLPYHTHRTYCRTEFGYEYCRYQVTGYKLP